MPSRFHKNRCENRLKLKCARTATARLPPLLSKSHARKTEFAVMLAVNSRKPGSPPAKFRCQTPQSRPAVSEPANSECFLHSSGRRKPLQPTSSAAQPVSMARHSPP